MKHILVTATVLAFGTMMFGMSLHAEPTPSDEPSAAAIQAKNDFAAAKKTLETAQRTGDDAAMLAVMSNRNPNIRLEAIEMIAALPSAKAKPALIAVLSNDRLWSERLLMGSGALTLQNLFLHAVQAAVKNSFGIDSTKYDLFDGTQRAKLLTKMTAK